jgi:GTPase SAR1 family protein
MNKYSTSKSSRGEVNDYQVAVLGTTMVGKSALIQRYTKKTFTYEYTPNLLDNLSYRFQYSNKYGILSSLVMTRDHRP